MILSVEINKQSYKFDSEKFYDISIPLLFNGEQPNSYKVEKASSYPYKDGNWIGDTRQGGLCNFGTIKLTPHCNGTHTECIGHITNERFSINNLLKESLFFAKLVTLDLKQFRESNDSYNPNPEGNELVISSNDLEGINFDKIEAIIIRSKPNDLSKQFRDYADYPAAYFTNEAMKILADSKLRHLLVDLPSVDRAYDQGKLTNHRIWWKVDLGSFDLKNDSRKDRTITEFIYVDDIVNDGNYLLNIQIAPFESDASPSKPILYPIEKS